MPCLLHRGTLAPGEVAQLHISYAPRSMGTFTCQQYTLRTPGGNVLPLALQGAAASPALALSAHALNWGAVPAGVAAPPKALMLDNHSPVPVAYQFQTQGGAFLLSRPAGVVPPHGSVHTSVRFTAGPAAAHHWQRLVCVVQDAQPLEVDLLATVYDGQLRPHPLRHHHISTYMQRVAAGGLALPADMLPEAMWAAASRLQTPAGAPPAAVEQTDATCQPYRLTAGEAVAAAGSGPLAGPVSWKLLFGCQDPARAVTVQPAALDFGACSTRTAAEQRSFIITNNTQAKLIAFVSLPSREDGAPGRAPPQPALQVFPESAELAPGGIATFRVAFRPQQEGMHYCQALQVCLGTLDRGGLHSLE